MGWKPMKDRHESAGESAIFQLSFNPDYDVKAAMTVVVMNRPN
jgi:hypothetical protein